LKVNIGNPTFPPTTHKHGDPAEVAREDRSNFVTGS
jgi:hypothetical protein